MFDLVHKDFDKDMEKIFEFKQSENKFVCYSCLTLWDTDREAAACPCLEELNGMGVVE